MRYGPLATSPWGKGRPGSVSFPEYPLRPVTCGWVCTHAPQNLTSGVILGLKIGTTFPPLMWTLLLDCSCGEPLPFELSQLTQIPEVVMAHSQSRGHLPQARLRLPCRQGEAGSTGPEARSWGRSTASHTECPAYQQGKGRGRQPTSVGSSQWRQVPIPCFHGVNHTEIKGSRCRVWRLYLTSDFN